MPRAELHLAGREPLRVRGLRFAPHERLVLVVEVGPASASRRLAAGANGSFVATFDELSIDVRARPSIVAEGARSGRVAASLPRVEPGPR